MKNDIPSISVNFVYCDNAVTLIAASPMGRSRDVYGFMASSLQSTARSTGTPDPDMRTMAMFNW